MAKVELTAIEFALIASPPSNAEPSYGRNEPLPLVLVKDTLPALAAAALAAHHRSTAFDRDRIAAGRDSVAAGAESGRHLIAAKAKLVIEQGHGHWEQWLADNFSPPGKRQALNYMTAARNPQCVAESTSWKEFADCLKAEKARTELKPTTEPTPEPETPTPQAEPEVVPEINADHPTERATQEYNGYINGHLTGGNAMPATSAEAKPAKSKPATPRPEVKPATRQFFIVRIYDTFAVSMVFPAASKEQAKKEALAKYHALFTDDDAWRGELEHAGEEAEAVVDDDDD